jgi:hypothetical protein
MQRMERKGPNNVDAYDLFLRGIRPAISPEDARSFIALLEAATQLEPDYADAWGELAVRRLHLRLYLPPEEGGCTCSHCGSRSGTGALTRSA